MPCALYYWNNSTSSTTNNTFQKIPGQGNETVTVTVIYGSQPVTKIITVPVKSFEGVSYSITGSDDICPNKTESYVISGVPAEYSVNWTCSGNLSKLSQNHNTASFKMLSAGAGTVNATINTPCGESLPLSKSTWSATPPTPLIQSSNICGNTPIDIYAFSSLQSVTYNWTVTGGTILNGQGSDWILVAPLCNWDKITVRLQTQNTCSLSPVVTKYIPIDCSGITPPQIIITPNPSNSEATVSIETNSKESNLKSGTVEEEFDENIEWSLEVYSQNYVVVNKQSKLKGNCVQINTSGWEEGIYVVRVKYKGEVLTDKLVVKK